jgi:hypothetical protein
MMFPLFMRSSFDLQMFFSHPGQSFTKCSNFPQ